MLIRKGVIIGIIILCKIYCRVGLNVYENLYNKEIGDGLCICSNGPLFPTRAFASDKCDLMYSMRFLSPAIDINYSARVVINSFRNPISDFNRCFNKDKTYKIKNPNKKKKYRIESLSEEEKDQLYIGDYHQTIIYLFPSSLGDLSIYTNRNNSFIKFLLSEHVFVHRINILASLFLLAEGVDVPLKIEGTEPEWKLVLKKISTGESIFSLSVYVMCNIKQPSGIIEPTKVKQREAISVINFFIDNKTNPAIREGGKYAEPKTYEEFKTGKFLNNARWLIQYYIFEYLDNENSIIELAKTVYSMLKESIQAAKENKLNVEVEYLESIIDKCFVKSNGDITKNKRIRALNLMYGESFLDSVFPFSGNISIPSYRSISSYNRKKNEINYRETYSSCVEAGLLGLFCCLAYDAETKEYSTEHMGEVSPDLKMFFTIYNKPFESADYTMYNEWNKVIGDLENKNIMYYKKNRNELIPGIINMLCVITEITGRYSKEKETIREFYTRLEENINQSELLTDVRSYIRELFVSLSKKCNLEKDSKIVKRTIKVDISNTSIQKNIIKRPDIFGNIIITYSVSEFEGGIILEHSSKHVSIKPFSNLNISELINLKKTNINNISLCAEGEENNTLTDYLIVRCIERSHDNKIVNLRLDIREIHPENINISEENSYLYPIEKLFLYNKFRNTEGHTVFMIYYIRECLIGHPFEENGPWARLISNLLGTLPLNNYNTMYNIIFSPLYKAGLYKNCFQKVTISPELTNRDYGPGYRYALYPHLIYCESPERILAIIKEYMLIGNKIGQYLFYLERNLSIRSQEKLLSSLTCGGKNITYLSKIAEFINSLDREDPRYNYPLTSNDMWAVWFNVCFHSDIFIYIIESIFDKFDSNQEEKKGRIAKERFNFSYLNADSKKIEIFLKDLIERSPETRKKFYYATEMYY
ncbi:hypothetical protein NEIRO03_1472 [Nematocida sp. AWRm78]|nr:hypothetical protein NEIRO02_1674 [Nematocida sp. AWRm79]KAI5184005.1 hypothetical protein NEIRO03_1472 [Nematocida sp. AWRm78]